MNHLFTDWLVLLQTSQKILIIFPPLSSCKRKMLRTLTQGVVFCVGTGASGCQQMKIDYDQLKSCLLKLHQESNQQQSKLLCRCAAALYSLFSILTAQRHSAQTVHTRQLCSAQPLFWPLLDGRKASKCYVSETSLWWDQFTNAKVITLFNEWINKQTDR